LDAIQSVNDIAINKRREPLLKRRQSCVWRLSIFFFEIGDIDGL